MEAEWRRKKKKRLIYDSANQTKQSGCLPKNCQTKWLLSKCKLAGSTSSSVSHSAVWRRVQSAFSDPTNLTYRRGAFASSISVIALFAFQWNARNDNPKSSGKQLGFGTISKLLAAGRWTRLLSNQKFWFKTHGQCNKWSQSSLSWPKLTICLANSFSHLRLFKLLWNDRKMRRLRLKPIKNFS